MAGRTSGEGTKNKRQREERERKMPMCVALIISYTESVNKGMDEMIFNLARCERRGEGNDQKKRAT